MNNKNTLKVLSINGGGMRGYYSALYLDGLKNLAVNRFNNPEFNLTNQLDMIVGTSTGAIIACGLANATNLNDIVNFYKEYGNKIFPEKMPTKWWQFFPFHNRKSINKKGNKALVEGLAKAFGSKTLEQVYSDTNTALVIPSVNVTTHKGYIFKTPHNDDTNHRDNNVTLVEACLASSAAPIYRTLANINDNLFVDGGLYANNPVLVALSEALRLTQNRSQKIEIYCLGMSPVVGSVIDSKRPDWGFIKWEFGSKVVNLSIDSQEVIFDYLSKEFAKHVNKEVSIVRFPQTEISPEHSKVLVLDNASEQALNLMQTLASNAIDQTNQLISDECSGDGQLIKSFLTNNTENK